MTLPLGIDAVVIGRNEGPRLDRCLGSLAGKVDRLVYVDSGSTDDSLEIATAVGAEIVELDMTCPFTAARARNAGVTHLGEEAAPLIQFVDGDCEMLPGWISEAKALLEDHHDIAAVCGRLRERFPDATLWNGLAQAEWDAEPGEVAACGGIVMIRTDAFRAAGGFNVDLIAGEEPELCLRLRRQGHRIWRLDTDMALHDIAMTRFGQWWTRTRRGGHAIAEGAALHGAGPERYRRREVRRALVWGLAIPLLAVVSAMLFGPLGFLVLLLLPAQVVRLRLRGFDWASAMFLTLGKLPEALGVIGYHLRQRSGAKARLIEYK